MESEKNKQKGQSTSAAAATLSMASMLSVVTGAFSSNEASSTLSDSEDEYQSQTEQENGNESQNEEAEPTPQGNPWDAPNLDRLREPRREKERVKPKFDHFSERAIRDEIEIEFNTKNGKKFTGSITPLEVKHGIFIHKLCFPDHSNFDGVSIGFKGKLVATIKLVTPINVDELIAVEYFDYIRLSTYRGKRIRGNYWMQD